MNEKTGEVFSIAKDNQPVAGCTISKAISSGRNPIIYFSFAAGTDISAEIFPYHKLILVAEGSIEVYGDNNYVRTLAAGDCIFTLTDRPMGMRTSSGAVYTEIEISKEDTMNNAVKAGEVFKLAELLPYQEGKIVNMDLAHNDKMKFVVMSFDAGAGDPRRRNF